MKRKFFNSPLQLLIASAASVVLILVAVEPGPKRAHATSSFGQNKAGENQSKQTPKSFEQFAPHEPSIGLLEGTRGGINPGSSHLSRGEAEYRAGRNAAAVPELKEAINEDPKSGDPHFILALALTGDGKLKEAIEEYKKVIELAQKDDPKLLAYYNMGNAYADLGEYQNAIDSYKEAIKLDAELSKPHNNLGLAYAALGKLDEAAAEFAEAVQLRPSYAEAHYNLGVAYLQLGRKQDAQEQQQILTKLDPQLAAKLGTLLK